MQAAAVDKQTGEQVELVELELMEVATVLQVVMVYQVLEVAAAVEVEMATLLEMVVQVL
jgi:hypothetical protein